MCDKCVDQTGLDYVGATPQNIAPEPLNTCLSSSSSSSLVSLSDDDTLNIPGGNLIVGAWSEVVSLHRQLIFLHERCQQLEKDLHEQQGSGNQVEVVASSVEQQRTEYQRLKTTVLCQKKLIAELRRHLRVIRTKKCDISSHHCLCCSHHTPCGSASTGECSVHNRNQGRKRSSLKGASTSHHLTDPGEINYQNSMRFHREKLPNQHIGYNSVLPPDQAMLSSLLKMKHTSSTDTDVLKQHLSATIDMCVRLTHLLNGQCVEDEEAASDKISKLADNSCSNGLDVEERQRRTIARLEEKLKKIKLSNEEWQRYALRRDQYIDVLAQRCSGLELSHSGSSLDNSLSEESQQQMMHILLSDERRKSELIEEAKKQVEDENHALKATLLRLGCEKRDVETRFSHALSRLKSSESRRVECTEKMEFLERQLAVYADDFNAEQRDRRLAQGRVAQLELELANALRQLHVFQPRVPANTTDFTWTHLDRTGSSNDRDDVSIPPLIGRRTVADKRPSAHIEKCSLDTDMNPT